MPGEGTVHVARVAMIKPFGAFAAIEGFRKEGLIHVSQLVNGRRVESPDEVVSVGDEVRVVVLSTENGRLSLSMRQVDQATGDVVGDSRAGGGGRERGGGGGDDPLPELFSVHRVEVMKLEAFGAFCKLPNTRKQGLLHISQLSNSRVEADDLPHILALGQEVFVKVISADAESGKIALSMKLVSQREGRDLDPTHVEATAEGERRGGGPRGPAGGGRDKESEMAAMQVPEYGGKRKGGGDYAMVSDGEDDAPRGEPAAGGTYNLKLPNGAAPPPPALDAQQKRQVELAAQLLAKKAKKDKKEKKSKKEKDKKEKKRKEKKEKKSSHKKDKKKSSSKRER